MMPLLMANLGEEYTIKQIGGREKDKTFLATLGFVVDGKSLLSMLWQET